VPLPATIAAGRALSPDRRILAAASVRAASGFPRADCNSMRLPAWMHLQIA